jgi:ABC-type multidrug transport system ATPase subunit
MASTNQVSLSFQDVRYSVQIGKGETKPILRGISGLVNPSEMLCILGPSGSGKTSLIHILGKKIKSDKTKDVSGGVLCNGRELSATSMMRISGFVSQEDVFNAELTVQETLRFAARLKLAAANRASRIDEVVKQLQLESCFKTHIGDDSNPYLKGISGGEKRRLAIALEILDPMISILVLDEPTSGLDAAAALNVCNVLRSLADAGITVAASLHQPRTSIMDKFNRLMILSAGRSVFNGFMADYVPYLQSDVQCQVPQHESPYDLMLDMLNPAIEKQNNDIKGILAVEGDQSLSEQLADTYDRSELCIRMKAEQPKVSGGVAEASMALMGKASVGWFSKFVTLLMRTFLIKMRDPMVLATQLSTAVFMGLIFGGLYFDSYKKETEAFAILDTQMCVTMTVVMALWLPFDVTLTFPKERRVFLRERKSGLYPTTAFYIARILADMPMHVVSAALMAVIIHPMAGLRMHIGLFMVANIIGVLVGAAVMQCIGAICRSFEEANLLMMPTMMFAMMTSSTFVREVPGWIKWMRDISMMGLLADSAMYWEFRDFKPEVGTTEELLDNFAILVKSDEDVMSAMLILLIIFLVARLITFLAVKFMHTGRSSCAENLAD